MTSPDSAVPAAPSDRTLAHGSAAFTYEADCADVHAELVEAKLRDYPWTRCSSSIAPDRTAMAGTVAPSAWEAGVAGQADDRRVTGWLDEAMNS